MKEVWTGVQRKVDKSKATAESKGLERAVADCGGKGIGRCWPVISAAGGYEKPTLKELIYVEAEQPWDKRKEEAV